MEQLVLILIIALISFINWLFKKSAELREKRKLERQTFDGGETLQRGEEPVPGEPPAGDPDDSMRRLMEALGLPQEDVPPVLPKRPATPPPIPELPKFVAPPAPTVRAASVPPPARPVRPSPPPPPAQPSRSPLRELLASPDGLKKAVMLSEILGQPKSLRS